MLTDTPRTGQPTGRNHPAPKATRAEAEKPCSSPAFPQVPGAWDPSSGQTLSLLTEEGQELKPAPMLTAQKPRSLRPSPSRHLSRQQLQILLNTAEQQQPPLTPGQGACGTEALRSVGIERPSAFHLGLQLLPKPLLCSGC